MNEFWLNVYKDGWMDIVKHASRESADNPAFRNLIAYRIHVRRK